MGTEAVLNTIFEEVGNVTTDEALQVLLVQRDHEVQHPETGSRPPSLSAIPFRHGFRALVRLGSRPVANWNAMTPASNFESRSNIT